MLVVLGHLTELMAATSGISGAMHIWTAVYAFHMPAFLFCGGYLSGKSSRDPITRIPKYILLYVIVQYTGRIILYACGYSSSWGGDLLQPVLGAWYLLVLIYASIIISFLKHNYRKAALIISVVLGILVRFEPTVSEVGAANRFFVFFPFFLIGYYFDWDSIRGVLARKRTGLVILAAAAEAVVLILYNYGILPRKLFSGAAGYASLFPQHMLLGPLWRLLAYAVSMVLILALLAITPRTGRLLSVIGKNSIYLYIVHIVLIQPVYGLINRRIPSAVCCIVGTIAVIAAVTAAVQIVTAVITKHIRLALNSESGIRK